MDQTSTKVTTSHDASNIVVNISVRRGRSNSSPSSNNVCIQLGSSSTIHCVAEDAPLTCKLISSASKPKPAGGEKTGVSSEPAIDIISDCMHSKVTRWQNGYATGVNCADCLKPLMYEGKPDKLPTRRTTSRLTRAGLTIVPTADGRVRYMLPQFSLFER